MNLTAKRKPCAFVDHFASFGSVEHILVVPGGARQVQLVKVVTVSCFELVLFYSLFECRKFKIQFLWKNDRSRWVKSQHGGVAVNVQRQNMTS
jgi:hypothetical protein